MTDDDRLTEGEAKTKWCPFARVLAETRLDGVLTGANAAFNRRPAMNAEGIEFPLGALCIGRACMAWRVATVPGAPFPTGRCGLAGQ